MKSTTLQSSSDLCFGKHVAFNLKVGALILLGLLARSFQWRNFCARKAGNLPNLNQDRRNYFMEKLLPTFQSGQNDFLMIKYVYDNHPFNGE